MSKNLKRDGTEKFFISIIGIVVIAIVLKELSHIFIPFVIAYFLFFIFSPINDYLREKKFPLYAVLLLDIFVTAFVMWGVSSFIIGSFISFGDQIPGYADKLNKIVSDAAVAMHIRDPFFRYFSIQRIVSKIDYKLLAGGIFSSTFSVLGNILFVLFFFIFVVIGHNTTYEAIKKRFVFKKVEPELKEIEKKYKTSPEEPNNDYNQWISDKLNVERQEKEEKLAQTFKAITKQIQRYIILKIAINLSAGIVITFLLYLFGIDFAIIWGLFVFLFNFIPSIGSAIALVLPVVMTLLQYESITYALLIALILAAIQTLFFNLIETNLIGKRLNLNPLLILMSVLIWGYIWGIVGMLLSVPLTAIIKIIISNSESENMKFISDLMSKE
ncbi:MAG: AI-2E family transporter [Ignavibacteriaceae bacterium]